MKVHDDHEKHVSQHSPAPRCWHVLIGLVWILNIQEPCGDQIWNLDLNQRWGPTIRNTTKGKFTILGMKIHDDHETHV